MNDFCYYLVKIKPLYVPGIKLKKTEMVKNLRNLIILVLINILFPSSIFCQGNMQNAGVGFERNYKLLSSSDLTTDKNFYLITTLGHSDKLRKILSEDSTLRSYTERQILTIKSHITDTCFTPVSLLASFKWSEQDSIRISREISRLYHLHQPLFDNLIDRQLRPSGYYQLFSVMQNEKYLLHAFGQFFKGTNYIIDQFGLGRKMRYPAIDSANYHVNSIYYKTVLKDIFGLLNERTDKLKVFYDPALSLAMQLMYMNDRDEPAKATLLERKENLGPLKIIGHVNWKKYKYAAIVIPGNGPMLNNTPISPENKLHCDIGAIRFLAKQAPFIMVSGGYCYPFRGPYCEALEMKKYLINKYGISADAIWIEAQARHTTTNFRNCNRIIIRSGMPMDMPYLFTSTKSQIDFVALDSFDKRNIRELNCLPYKNKKRISDHDIVFFPTVESLHMDPYDPLDP